jgi:hypothetical protein
MLPLLEKWVKQNKPFAPLLEHRFPHAHASPFCQTIPVFPISHFMG